MKKKIRKILIILISFVILTSAILLGIGFNDYRIALSQHPVLEKVSELRKSEDYVGFEDIPEVLVHALVAVEDRRFYERDDAFDLRSFGRATWVNLTTLSLSEGASTLQQQVAKNLYWDYKTSVTQKIAQMFMMHNVNSELSKNEIIEVYFNIIYFGDGYIGLHQAAKGYFNKLPQQLSEAEATLLAGLPQAPAIYQLSSGMEKAKVRQKDVLWWMVEEGYLTQEKSNEIYSTPVEIQKNKTHS